MRTYGLEHDRTFGWKSKFKLGIARKGGLPDYDLRARDARLDSPE
jgi:hypothetical protein